MCHIRRFRANTLISDMFISTDLLVGFPRPLQKNSGVASYQALDVPYVSFKIYYLIIVLLLKEKVSEVLHAYFT
jgi:hypothetical protein